jgi:hypothetical protein
MNCFEARKGFTAFWRRTMPPAERGRLVEHLKVCTQCDHSFRVFALSAPVVHSESEPVVAASAARAPLNLVRPRRFASNREEQFARKGSQWPWQVAAAVALLFIGGVSAWSSTRWPVDNFAESVAGEGVDVDGAIYSSDSSVTSFGSAAQEPALFDSIAPDPSAPGNSGLAG